VPNLDLAVGEDDGIWRLRRHVKSRFDTPIEGGTLV
jgi:hypothetical protein